MLNEAHEGLVQRTRDGAQSSGTRTLHDALRPLRGKARDPGAQGQIGQGQQRRDGMDTVPVDVLHSLCLDPARKQSPPRGVKRITMPTGQLHISYLRMTTTAVPRRSVSGGRSCRPYFLDCWALNSAADAALVVLTKKVAYL